MITPLQASILFHFLVCDRPFKGIENQPQQEAIVVFIRDGIVSEFGTDNKRYKITRKGRAWANLMLKTPYPEMVWVDPRDKNIDPLISRD